MCMHVNACVYVASPHAGEQEEYAFLILPVVIIYVQYQRRTFQKWKVQIMHWGPCGGP